MDFKDIFILCIQLATPFAILYLTHWNTKQQKEHERTSRLERELAENKRKELNDSLETAITALDSAREDVENLQKALLSVQTQYDNLRSSLVSISNANRMNGRYTHELANLVSSLSEEIRNQHPDSGIGVALTRYRNFESDALGSIITGELE